MNISVLAVDDSRTMRDMITLALSSEGFDVELAEDGEHGLEVLDGIDPDVIITDINMPDINGLELLAFIGKSPRQQGAIKILISTQADGPDAKRGVELGADAFLAKPFGVDDLRTLIQGLVHGRQEVSG